MRQPNEVDFWRGFALVTIFINHIPGIWYEQFTYKNISISDSAELFVFLAGWSLRHVTDQPSLTAPRLVLRLGGRAVVLYAAQTLITMMALAIIAAASIWLQTTLVLQWNNAAAVFEDPVQAHVGLVLLTAPRLVLRLGGRAVVLYAAQTLITMMALAIIAAASIWLQTTLVLQWNNAAAVFEDPVQAHVGLVLLTHQLGYFDILPLYIVLMLAAPLIALIDRYISWALLPLSVAIWAATLTFGINLPTWPVEGRWFFNPLAWQLVFVLGFVLGADRGIGHAARINLPDIRWIALPVVLAGGVAAYTGFWPDPMKAPEPQLFFMMDKTYATPARLVHLLALVAVFSGGFAIIMGWIRPLGRFFSMLGRNSLNVFCVGSILSLAGQVLRFAWDTGIPGDTFVVVFGILALGFTAWISEWRARSRG